MKQKLLYSIGFLLIFVTPLAAQWKEYNGGNFGGSIKSIVVRNNILYACSNGCGIFKSTDYGSQWTHINNGLSGFYIKGLILAGENLVAYNSDGAVYFSFDEGQSWNLRNRGIHEKQINCIISSGEVLLAGTNGDVYFSDDNGENWAAIDSGLYYGNINSLGIIGDCYLANTDVGTFYSENRGKSWIMQKNNGMVDPKVLSFKTIGDRIYACSRSGLYISKDKGKSWTVADTSLPKKSTYFLVNDGENLYCGQYYDIYLSKDNGESWSLLLHQPKGSNVLTCFATAGSYYFAGAGGPGILRSDDGGVNWYDANKGINNIFVRKMKIYDDRFYTSFIKNNISNGVNISTDKGLSWFSNYTGNDYKTKDFSDFLKIGSKFVIGNSFGIYISDDEGRTWTENNNGLSDNNVICLLHYGDRIYAGTESSLYVSEDTCKSWSKVIIKNLMMIPFRMTAKDSVLLLAMENGLLISSDSGKNWTYGNISYDVNDAVFDGNRIYAATYRGLYYTEDFGKKWQKIDLGVDDSSFACIAIEGNVIIVSSQTGLYYSGDRGKGWINVSGGIINNYGWLLLIDDEKVYRGTNSCGLYMAAVADLDKTAVESIEKTVENLELYPNPASGKLIVEAGKDFIGMYKVTIINMDGLEVYNSGFRDSDISTNIEIDTETLLPGTYICRISGGGITKSGKFSLIN